MPGAESWSTKPVVVRGKRALEVSLVRLRLVVEEGPDRGAVAELDRAAITIGTAPGNDLQLNDTTASRQHAVVTLGAGDALVEDLGSTNGTFVGGTRIKVAHAADGARVRIGRTVLRVEVGPRRVTLYPDDEQQLGDLLGRSEPMRDLFALVRQLARTDLPVLVHGETGTGKELIARALHAMGPRAAKPFLVLDCGSVVPELLRSEIFGHEKGAFTGAVATQRGVLEQADGGTVFVDEIGELDLAVQPNLLRALEGRHVTRIGSQAPVPVDFRLVAATHRDLEQRTAEGTFRQDLYFRLACVTLHVPPLRERPGDVELLARTFATRCAERNQLPAPQLAAPAVALLERQPWPGNVRQLKNVVEACCLFSKDGIIDDGVVERALARGSRQAARAAAAPAVEPGALEAAERDVLVRALEATGWKRKEAARRLGISPNTMFAKIKRYGLRPRGEE